MMEITAEIRALIDKAAAGVELAGDEYIDSADGLIHCKKCGGQRQTVVPCFGKPGYFITKHPNFKHTADADDKNAFDIEAFLSARLKLKPNEVCDVYEVDTKGA